MRFWNHYQARAAETGIPMTLIDITTDLEDRLEDLENEGHDNA